MDSTTSQIMCWGILKHLRSLSGSIIHRSSRARRPVQPRAGPRRHKATTGCTLTHASASSGARTKRMCSTHGPDPQDPRVERTSSKHFQPSSPATDSRHAPKTTPPHIPFRLRTFCNDCIGWSDRRSQCITPHQCTMLVLSSCHASTRRITRLTKLPRQAADGLA